jgi:hypothetical protein
MALVIAPSISYTVAEERIRRQRGREKPSAGAIRLRVRLKLQPVMVVSCRDAALVA